MITRRCRDRQFLLRPDPVVNNIITYCHGYLCSKLNVRVLAVCAMSNHLHIVVEDHATDIVDFNTRLNSLVGRMVNAHLGRLGTLWDATEKCSLLHLADGDAVVDKMVYTVANPPKANLVAHVRDWPGVTSWPAHLSGKPLAARRPHHFCPDDSSPPGNRQTNDSQAACF